MPIMTPTRRITRRTIGRAPARGCSGSTGLEYTREADSEIGFVPVPDGVDLHPLGDPRRVGLFRRARS